MAYDTYFNGNFEFSKKLNEAQVAYLKALSKTRRVKRDSSICEKFPDPIREAVGLPIGTEGEFCVFGSRDNENLDETIIDNNKTPITQPDLYIDFVPSENGEFYEWNKQPRFQRYFEWLGYVSLHILKKWGIFLKGKIEYEGEVDIDRGKITANENSILMYRDKKIIRRIDLR